MSKELKIKGPLDKDNQQVYIDDAPTNIFINEDGRIKTATIKQTVEGNEVEIKNEKGGNILMNTDLSIKSLGDLTIDIGGDLTIDIGDGKIVREDGGDIIISEAGIMIDLLKKIYLDGSTDTYIWSAANDTISFTAGGETFVGFKEVSTGNIVRFIDAGVGFTQREPTYDATDTDVSFATLGNKQFLTFGSGNITDLNLTFPDVSCNCILLVKQDGTGSRTITNYKTFSHSGGSESTVLFAGGSNPTLTTAGDKVDIFSFYWDDDNQKAYGVVTHNF